MSQRAKSGPLRRPAPGAATCARSHPRRRRWRPPTANPDRPVVFFVAGFETTAAPVAAMMAEGLPGNLSVLLSARRTWPAVAMLLDSGDAGFDGLIAPGHVASIMGADEWRFVVEQHDMPTAVAGFTHRLCRSCAVFRAPPDHRAAAVLGQLLLKCGQRRGQSAGSGMPRGAVRRHGRRVARHRSDRRVRLCPETGLGSA